MRKAIKIAALCLAAVVSCCANVLAMAADGVNWEKSTITATGSGIVPPGAVSAAQGRLMAKRAAVADAYRQLAEMVKGVHVDSETTVANFMVLSDVTTTKVEAVIKGARVIDEKQLIDGSYTVTMEIPLFGVENSLAGAVFERPAVREPFPQPTYRQLTSANTTDATGSQPVYTAPTAQAANPQLNVQVTVNTGNSRSMPTKFAGNYYPPYYNYWPYQGSGAYHPYDPYYNPYPYYTPQPGQKPDAATTTPATTEQPKAIPSQPTGNYTGLVVDCTGLGLKPVMSPVIKNAEGTPIYGYKNLDFDLIVQKGMASYTRDINEAPRAGDNPLTINAVSLENFNGNPVISVEDADRVLSENELSGFLDATNVVFVR